MSFSPGASLQDAVSALTSGRHADAMAIAKQLTAQDSSNFDAWQVLGAASSQCGQFEEAINAFNQCVRQRPNVPQGHFNLAQALLATGQKDRARSELETCLSLDPSYGKATAALNKLGDAAEAGTSVPGIGSSGPAPGGGLAAGLGAPGIGAAPGFAAPPAFGAPPPMGAAPGFGAPAPGFAAPPPGGYGAPGAPTQFQTMPAGSSDLPGSTKAWAIAAIVLGCLLALGNLFHLNIVGIILNGIFIAGGVGVLGRHNWGRITLLVGSVLGIIGGVFAVLGGVLVLAMGSQIASNPAFQASFQQRLSTSGNMAAMNPSALASLGVGVVGGMVLFLAAIFLGFNIPMMLNMKSERTCAAMVD